MDIKRRCESFAMVADTDDDREANARVKGHMSIMCIISLLNYQALNMGAALPHLFFFPSPNSPRSVRHARRHASASHF